MNKLITLVAFVLLSTTQANAGPIAIINGLTTTSETGTTNSITTQLTTLHQNVGNSVTVFDLLPTDLSLYDQVWDIRFSNASALSIVEQTDYLSYLQSGGGMFLMGENSNFTTRNDSIFSLINSAGGGDLAFGNVSSTQTVNGQFTGPNAVTSITYLAPGGANGNGSGDWITNSGSTGTGIAWGVGDLTNATAGALTTIFDVNFMQTTADVNSQNLTKNLIGFISTQVNPDPTPTSVSEPSTLAILGLSLMGLAVRRFKKQS
jgi:hypothetical protein